MGKIVGIHGSPRRGHNSSILLSRVLAGAEIAGAEVVEFSVQEMGLHPCRACDACRKTGTCAVRDDFPKILEALQQSSGLIIASPIYFDHVSAQTKIFIDRLYCLMGNRSAYSLPKGIQLVTILTWGDSSPTLYRPVADWVEERFSAYHGMKPFDTILAADTDQQPVAGRSEFLQKAYQLGIQLAKSAVK